ncbi:MAG: ubiquitin carboxyl-terminal hydrolase 14, partial [Amphiamblys sp. WSBS2006]
NRIEEALSWVYDRKETGKDGYRLAAFCIHQGTSPEFGHYVTAVRNEDGWLLLNDEYLFSLTDEDAEKLSRSAYISFYEK